MPWLICRLARDEAQSGPPTWSIKGKRQVTDAEAATLQRAIRQVEDEVEQELANHVLTRFRAYFAAVSQLTGGFEELRKTEPSPLRRISSELRGRMFDWLQGIRAFLDQSEASFKRRYGRRSPEVERLKHAFAQEFDGHFAYRFFTEQPPPGRRIRPVTKGPELGREAREMVKEVPR